MDIIYPRFETSTAQDLMSIVAQAYERGLRVKGITLPAKARWQRALLEPLGIVLGTAAAALMELMPEKRALGAHEFALGRLSSPNSYPFDPCAPSLERARLLLEELSRGGKKPALLAVISHPPVMGDMAHLNFELMRHGVLALRRLRGGSCRPRLVVAVDAFALDGVPLWQEGLYAGFMSRYHLGLDRLIRTRLWPGRLFLRKAAWFSMPRRLLRELGAGGEVGLVLGGGVPSTARCLYAFREWLGRELRRSPRARGPAEILRELGRNSDFRSFRQAVGPPRWRSAWRTLEAWCLGALAGSAGEASLGAREQEVLRACLAALGLGEEGVLRALSGLEREWARETPYRERFFRLLAGRVLSRGRPILFLPVVHRTGGGPGAGVEVRQAWGWAGPGSRGIKVLRPGLAPESMEAGEFARTFVEENFK